jgi:hypothetical protein
MTGILAGGGSLLRELYKDLSKFITVFQFTNRKPSALVKKQKALQMGRLQCRQLVGATQSIPLLLFVFNLIQSLIKWEWNLGCVSQ